MIPQLFYERYLEIQVQILDRKVSVLKEKVKDINSEVMRDFRRHAIQLERKKYKIIREYNSFKKSGFVGGEDFIFKINSDLQEVCRLYNSLFSQVESSH